MVYHYYYVQYQFLVFSKISHLSSWMFFGTNHKAGSLLQIIHSEGLFSFYLHTHMSAYMCDYILSPLCEALSVRNIDHITHMKQMVCLNVLMPVIPIIIRNFHHFLILSYLCALQWTLLKYKLLNNRAHIWFICFFYKYVYHKAFTCGGYQMFYLFTKMSRFWMKEGMNKYTFLWKIL